MRRSILFAALLVPLLAGCGNRNLVLTVDILSFMDPASKVVNYSIPAPIPSDTVEVFADSLNLLQGVGDVTNAVAASLDLAASFDNTSGAATGDLLIYIASANASDPFTTTPFADVPFTLLPGQITNVSTHVEASPALAEALTHDRAMVGVRVVFNGTSFPIQGTETLTQLQATVILKKDL
ncbi:MAG TPA: hypothetical protein VFD83_00975 [Candidatus Polarisedimenticolia bacterium]|nr:hypothetical protein [Candidatus Polarisedimenticolia bacterium]